MLAAVYHGPRDLRVEDYPLPNISPDELLLKVESASICATDIRIFNGSHRKYEPGTVRIPGHELIGTIAEIGARVQGLSAGGRVFIARNMGCGHCAACLLRKNNLCPDYQAFGITMDGGFAQYMRITAAAIQQGNVIPIGPDLDAAAFSLAEPFACVLHGQDAVNTREGDTVLIQGAGPIGLMHVMLAHIRGASRIIVADKAPERLSKARQLGAGITVDISQEDLASVVSEVTGGLGASVIIVAAPVHAAQAQAIHLAAVGGRINLFAGLPKEKPTVELDANAIHYKELIVTGTTGCSTDDCRRAADLVGSRKIDLSPLVTQRFPLEAAVDAFAAATHPSQLKVVLQPRVIAAHRRIKSLETTTFWL
jgi:L-iditol 2-dehydrogenase